MWDRKSDEPPTKFKSKVTGEVTYSDPRLLPIALQRLRGGVGSIPPYLV